MSGEPTQPFPQLDSGDQRTPAEGGTASSGRLSLRRWQSIFQKWVNKKFPFLKPLRGRWWWIVAITILSAVVIATVVKFSGEIANVWWQRYGPNVVIGVLPPPPVPPTYGMADLVNEYVFNHGIVREARDEQQLLKIASEQPPTAIRRFQCPGSSVPFNRNVYKITMVSQNLGHRTAERYQMTISFSGMDRDHHDPGVRILYVGTDDIRVAYLYQHEPNRSRPDCVPEMKGDWNVAPLARQTYGELGLSRDMVILIGSLPAQVFQTIDIVAYVPCSSTRFMAIFQVQCPNCRFFYRMISLAQVLALPDDCGKAAHSGTRVRGR